MYYEKGPFRLGRECWIANHIMQACCSRSQKPCPINCITSSKGELSPVPLRRSPDGNSASYQPSPGNKQGIYCHLVFTGANCVQFDFPPPFSFHSVNKETTYKKNDTRQTVSCWHYSDLGIILPLWNAEKACRLRVQFWKEVGEAKAKQDALQWNAVKKNEHFNQDLNSSSVGQDLLISS